MICRIQEKVVIIYESYINVFFAENPKSHTQERKRCVGVRDEVRVLTHKRMDMNIFTVNGNANVRLNEAKSRMYSTVPYDLVTLGCGISEL